MSIKNKYIIKFLKKQRAQAMFNNLRAHIGEEVKYSRWNYNIIFEGEGLLEEVNDYDNVVVDGDKMNFLWSNDAIINIKTLDNKVLYENKEIEKEYFVSSPEEMNEQQEKMFGEPLDKIISKINKVKKR